MEIGIRLRDDSIVPLKELANALDVSELSLLDHVDDGRLESYELNDKVYVLAQDVVRWFRLLPSAASQEVLAAQAERGRQVKRETEPRTERIVG